LELRIAKGTGRDARCSGETPGADVECVDVLVDGFTEPRRGVVQVAVQCGRPERITRRFLVVLASSLIYLTG
jgi:hypothetical protein